MPKVSRERECVEAKQRTLSSIRMNAPGNSHFQPNRKLQPTYPALVIDARQLPGAPQQRFSNVYGFYYSASGSTLFNVHVPRNFLGEPDTTIA